MNVQLYVYDLSGGLARSMSGALLGVQIDAIYHTSIVMKGLEYVYDSGLKVVHPGSTHLGQPMQIIDLGTTGLPIDVVMEYLDSMKDIYTAEVCILGNGGEPIGITLVTNDVRHTISGPTTATISPTTLQHSSLARAYQTISQTSPRLCLILRLAE
jgi:hypothetical protein